MHVDGSKIKDGSVIEADLCIIGSGAAGLSIASEFKDAGLTIAIIESGAPEFQEDAQALNKVECTGLGIKERSRFRQFGGSTTAWSGKWLPLNPSDFKTKHWIEYSGWPITFEDIADYYTRATRMHNGPEISAYFDEWTYETSSPDEQEPRLVPVSVYWMGVYDLDFSLTVGRFIEKSDQVTLYYSLTASNIILDASLKAVDTVETVSKTGGKVRVKARQFILAGGGIENARLLLASNTQIESGIGNGADNVGRFFMDHPSGNVATVELEKGASFPECLGMRGKSNGKNRRDIGVRLREDVVEANASVNSYMVFRPKAEHVPSASLRQLFSNLLLLKRSPLQWKIHLDILKNLIKLEKINFIQVVSYRLLIKFGLKSKTPNVFSLNFHIEQIPSPENRITLSDKRDAHGQPLAAVNWELSDIEAKSIDLLHQEMGTLLEQNQCGTLHWNDGAPANFKKLVVKDSSHHMGSTRMGDDELTSVVDRNCKVHGIENLHIAGSSVFPTSGYSNPTFTLVALAIRLADHLKKLYF